MGLRTGADISRLSAVGVLQGEGGTVGQRSLAFLAVSIFLCAIAASLLQPLVNSPASPIRAPLIQPGLEMQVLMAGIAFVLLIVLALVVAALYSRTIAQAPAVALWPAALVVFLAPLYFMTFTLTKESTAFLEMILKP
jgi:hypothetical protein